MSIAELDSEELKEAVKDTLGEERMPTWSELVRIMCRIAQENGEWGGYPIPLDSLPLVLEERHPMAQTLSGMSFDNIRLARKRGNNHPEERDDPPLVEYVNSWYSLSRRCHVTILRVMPMGGETVFVVQPDFGAERLVSMLNLFEACDVWNIDAEVAAQSKLLAMVGVHKFKQYMMTGSFLETSSRSRVTYVFRKLRPTVAMAPYDRNKDESMKVLACLCLHPIGYYETTWAGVMCPTDDVIAHLTMMRGDEHLFWRKANQHPAWIKEAGL